MIECILALAVGSSGVSPREPRVEEKPAAEWVKKLDGPEAEQALAALVKLGKGAIPALTAELKAGTSKARCHAARALGRMGAAAEPALPELTNTIRGMANDEALAWCASSALSNLQYDARSAVPPLCAILGDKSQSIELRCLVAFTLGGLGHHAKDSVAKFVAVLAESPTSLLQPVAALNLGRVGEPTVRSLKTEIGRAENMTLFWCIFALGRAGADAKEAALKLTPFVTSDDWKLHPVVFFALERIGSSASALRERALKEKQDREKQLLKGGLYDQTAQKQPRLVLEFFRKLGAPVDAPGMEMSLPAQFRDTNGDGILCIGDIEEELASHLVERLDSFAVQIEAGKVTSFAEIRSGLKGVPGLGEALRIIGERSDPGRTRGRK